MLGCPVRMNRHGANQIRTLACSSKCTSPSRSHGTLCSVTHTRGRSGETAISGAKPTPSGPQRRSQPSGSSCAGDALLAEERARGKRHQTSPGRLRARHACHPSRQVRCTDDPQQKGQEWIRKTFTQPSAYGANIAHLSEAVMNAT